MNNEGRIAAAIVRLDGFLNTLTGMGSEGDKGSSFDIEVSPTLQYEQLRAAYHGEYYCRRAVDIVANDAVKEGWDLLDPGKPLAVMDERWRDETDRLQIPNTAAQADKYARAFGTGYMIPITRDGRSLQDPLDLNELWAVDDVLSLDAWECKPQRFYSENQPGTPILSPAMYRLNISTGNRLVGFFF